MSKILLSMMVMCALVTVGCDRKAPDNTNPKTSAGSSGSSGSGSSSTNDSSKSSSTTPGK